jgi:hypothetical protein
VLYVLRRWIDDDTPPENIITYLDRADAEADLALFSNWFPTAHFDIFEAPEAELKAQGVVH